MRLRAPIAFSIVLALLGGCELATDEPIDPSENGKADGLQGYDIFFEERSPSYPLSERQVIRPTVAQDGARLTITTDDIRYGAPIGETVLELDKKSFPFQAEYAFYIRYAPLGAPETPNEWQSTGHFLQEAKLTATDGGIVVSSSLHDRQYAEIPPQSELQILVIPTWDSDSWDADGYEVGLDARNPNGLWPP